MQTFPFPLRPFILALMLVHLMLLVGGLALAEDDAKKLPADAQALVDREGMDEFHLKVDFDAKVYKARGELVAKLAKVQETVTKKGDLDTAMLIKAKIADLSKDLPADESKKEKVAIVGRWNAVWDRGEAGTNLAHDVWEVEVDGSCTSGPIQGKWKVRPAGGFEIRWDQGMVDTIKDIGSTGRTTASRSNGKTISLQRQ